MWKLLLRLLALFGHPHKETTLVTSSVSPSPSPLTTSSLSFDQTPFELQHNNNDNEVVSVTSSVRFGPSTTESTVYYSFLKQGNIVFMRFGNDIFIPDGVSYVWDQNSAIPTHMKPYYNVYVPIMLVNRRVAVYSGTLLIYGNYSVGFSGFRCDFNTSINTFWIRKGTMVSWAVSPSRW